MSFFYDRRATDVKALKWSDLYVGYEDALLMDVEKGDIDRFAELSGDYAPIHMQEEFAREQGFADRVAHGLYLGSLISALIGNRLPGKYGLLQSIGLEFKKPLIPPEKIRIRGAVTNLSESTGQISIHVSVLNAKDELLATAKVKSLFRKR